MVEAFVLSTAVYYVHGSGHARVRGCWIAVVLAGGWLSAMTTRLKSELPEKVGLNEYPAK